MATWADFAGSSEDSSQNSSNGSVWANFANSRNQIAQVNAGNSGPYTPSNYAELLAVTSGLDTNNPWRQAQQDAQQYNAEIYSGQKRKMTDLERMGAQARQFSDFVNNAAGNFLFGEPQTPEEAARLSEIRLENVPRFVVNAPGMLVGALPDTFAYGLETALGTPLQDADLETGLIEDRQLTPEERLGSAGYTALSLAGAIPGAGGLASKIGGTAIKGIGKAVGKESIREIGSIVQKGTKKYGIAEAYGANKLGIKEGKELNPYRWVDAALETGKSTAFEAGQEAGQTYFEDMRNGDLNEGTDQRMLEGAFWGGLIGGGLAGAGAVGGTAITNSRASHGLDRYGAPIVQPNSSDPNWFDFYNSPELISGTNDMLPENARRLLELDAESQDKDRMGTSMKGVAGRFGQNVDGVYYGVRGIRRSWNAASDENKAKYASSWYMSVDDFESLMQNDDLTVCNKLNEIIRANWDSKTNRILFGNAKAPFTDPNAMQTFFVLGITPGNVVQFSPGLPPGKNADLDGDAWSIYSDKSMASWDYLPTRHLSGSRAVPAEGEVVSKDMQGKVSTGIGESKFGFEQAGVTYEGIIQGSVIGAINDVLNQHFGTGPNSVDLKSRIISDFQKAITEKENKNTGVNWEMRVAKWLSDLVAHFEDKNNGFSEPLLGDDLVADILSAIIKETAVFTDIQNAVDAFGVNSTAGNTNVGMQSMKADLPITDGRGPKGWSGAITQIQEWFGRLNYFLTKKESPMFRQKQMVSWNTKIIRMLDQITEETGLSNISSVEAAIKWCEQMLNNSHLPVDYIESAFKSKVLNEVLIRTGLSSDMKLVKNVSLDTLKEVVTDAWNSNAAVFDEATAKIATTLGDDSIRSDLYKTKILENQPGSFYRVLSELFGSWDVEALFDNVPSWAKGMTLDEMIEYVASDARSYDLTFLSANGVEANQIVEGLVGDYQGKQAAAMAGFDTSWDVIKEGLAEYSVDDKGAVLWKQEDQIEAGFLTGMYSNALGPDASLYLGIAGPKQAAKGPWGQHMFTRDKNKAYRTLLSQAITWSWRKYIDAVKTHRADAYIAFNEIDFKNPINIWIYRHTVKEVVRDSDGNVADIVYDNAFLDALTDPTRGSFEEWAKVFEDDDAIHVRKGANMLLYCALDFDGSSIGGSAFTNKARVVNNYSDAFHGSPLARARTEWEAVEGIVTGVDQQNTSDIVAALKDLSTSRPLTVNDDSYVAAIHDAAFGSTESSNKAKATIGASQTAQGLEYIQGGYTSSFLNQLGFSVGAINARVEKQIIEAIKRAVFDPDFSQKVTVNDNGDFIIISQAELFARVDQVVDQSLGVTWGNLKALFDKFPQILTMMMPQSIEPLSVDGQTVTTVMTDRPVNAIKGYLKGRNNPSYRKKIQVSKVKNALVMDSDSPLLTLGYIDREYDSCMANGEKFSREVKEALDKWSNTIYELACIKDPVARRQAINKAFGEASIRDYEVMKNNFDALIERLERRQKHASDRYQAMIAAELASEMELEYSCSVDVLSTYRQDPGDIDDDDSVIAEAQFQALLNEEELTWRVKYEKWEPIIHYGMTLVYGDSFYDSFGKVSQKTFNEQVEKYKKADPNLTDEEAIARVNSRLDDLSSSKTPSDVMLQDPINVFITKEDIDPSSNSGITHFIEKIKRHINSQQYKRLASEYGDLDLYEEELQAAVDAINNGENVSKNSQYLSDQADYWNIQFLNDMLQSLYDEVFLDSNHEQLSMMMDAKDFVAKLVEEIVEEGDIETTFEVDPDNISIPDISYRNKALSSHVRFASIEIETGIAPISSGQNAGAYQDLAVLDLIGKTYACPVEPRTGLTRDEINQLFETQAAPLNIVDANGSISILRETQVDNYTDAQLAALKIAPQCDCLSGICHIHNIPSLSNFDGDFIGGRFDIARLCWYLSEKRVFKSKKKMHVFRKIAHVVKTANDLKNYKFNGRDRASLLAELYEYQEKLTEHINDVFIEEKMQGEFDIDTARVVAQFMTPMIDICYTDANGQMRYSTISTYALSSDGLFAAQSVNQDLPEGSPVEPIDWNSVITVSPVSMSILDVCKKLSYDVRAKFASTSEVYKGKIPSFQELNSAVEESMMNWTGKHKGGESVDDFLYGLQSVRRSTKKGVMYASSPNSMQNFMDLSGTTQKTVESYASKIRSASYSKQEADLVQAINETVLNIDDDNLVGTDKALVVTEVHASEFGSNPTEDVRSIIEEAERPLSGNVRSDFLYPGLSPAMLIDGNFNNFKDRVLELYEQAKNLHKLVLVPIDSAQSFENIVRESRELRYDGYVTAKGKNYAVYDPNQSNIDMERNLPVTYLRSFSPEEMWFTINDRGRFGTDDSAFVIHPRKSSMTYHDQGSFSFTKDMLMGNAPKTASGLFSGNGSMSLVDLTNADTRNDIKEELELLKDGKRSRLILPKFNRSDKQNDDVFYHSVEDFLNTPNDQLMNGAVKRGTISENQTMAFIKVNNCGTMYYVPLIFNTGGTTASLDQVFIFDDDLRRGEVKIYFDGKLSPEQYEGLKYIFETIAYKAYGTVMNQDVVDNMPHLGFNLPIVGGQGNWDVDGLYSGSTEDGRFIDLGYTTKMENIGNLAKIIAHNYFMTKDQSGKWVPDYDRFEKIGVSNRTLDRLLDFNNRGAWQLFVDGGFNISDDPIVNGAMRKVAAVALQTLPSGASPLYAFANVDTNGNMGYNDFNVFEVYGVLNDNELERFFHAIDPNICFDGESDLPGSRKTPSDPTPIIDKNGFILCDDGKYRRGHVHFLHATDDSTMLGHPTGQVRWGSQGVLNLGLIRGLDYQHGAKDIKVIYDYIMAKGEEPRAYTIGGRNVFSYYDTKSEKELRRIAERDKNRIWIEERYLEESQLTGRRRNAREKKLRNEARQAMGKLIHFVSDDKKNSADIYGADKATYQSALGKFRNTIKLNLNELEIHQLFRQTTASTYNNGNGSMDITLTQFVEWVNDVCRNIERGKWPFDMGVTTESGRPMLCYVTSSLLDRLLESPIISNLGGYPQTRESLIAMMDDQIDDVVDTLQFRDNAQKEAIYTMMDLVGSTYGKDWLSRPIGDFGMHLGEIIDSNSELMKLVYREEPYAGLLEENRRRSAELIKREDDLQRRRNMSKTPSNAARKGGFIAQVKEDNGKGWIFNIISTVSKIMAIATPNIPISAIVCRAKNNLLTRGLLMASQLAPDGSIRDTPGITLNNKEAVKNFSHNQEVQYIWRALNTYVWSGADILELQTCRTFDDFKSIVESKKKGNWLQKVEQGSYDAASGWGFGLAGTIENWLIRYAATTTTENSPWLCEAQADGRSLFEHAYEENPVNFMLDSLTLRDDNPDYFRANEARNFVIDGEHAAKSMFGLAWATLFRDRPLGNAIVTTGLCRFPQYAWNMSGWALQHFAPVSTAAYIFRKLVIDYRNSGHKGKFADYINSLGDIESTQKFGSLREAMLYDSMMIGSTALVCALVGAGAFEPPDDEYYDEYAGNPEEWTICGFRIAENWWLMDILGPMGAMAATWKSFQIGKPRLDLLTNWMTQSLYSNPALKAADVARTLLDPTEQYLEEYSSIIDQYDNSFGGSPDLLEAWLDDQVSFGLNWFGQFVTPAFMREISRSREFLKYERSYKTVENDDGTTERVDYLDAQIRKVTRHNMVLGFMMNLLPLERDDYMGNQMPKVKIPDQNAIDSLNYYSLNWADGTEKPSEYKQLTAFEVISILSSTDDLNGLVNDGFVIPYDTKIYVSQMLNDIRQAEVDSFNDWVQDTGLDNYVIGDGDWNEGARLKSLAFEAYNQDLDGINEIYEKLWSEELNKGLQMYYREATTYARTASGEYYATGYRPASAISLPVLLAPGSLDNNDGTLGLAGNWETPSEVVEGASAGGRALVPIPLDSNKKPKLQDFGSDKNNGYSDTEAGAKLAEQRNNPSRTNTTSNGSNGNGGNRGKTSTPSYPVYRSTGGGGGGYSRSYGSSAPNIYGPSISLPSISSTRIMNTDRIQRPEYDYLRPNFETKGSREAYKRSDI